MVTEMMELLSWVCLLAGSLFCVVGGLGLLRFSDLYSRTHGTAITETLGAGLVLLGLILDQQVACGLEVNVKLALILALLLVTNPTTSHALVKAAFARGVKLEIALEEGDDVPL